MLLISECSQAKRDDQYAHLCACVCQQEDHKPGTIITCESVCICFCVFVKPNESINSM